MQLDYHVDAIPQWLNKLKMLGWLGNFGANTHAHARTMSQGSSTADL